MLKSLFAGEQNRNLALGLAVSETVHAVVMIVLGVPLAVVAGLVLASALLIVLGMLAVSSAVDPLLDAVIAGLESGSAKPAPRGMRTVLTVVPRSR